MFIPTVRRVPSRFLKPNKKRGIKIAMGRFTCTSRADKIKVEISSATGANAREIQQALTILEE